MAFKLVTVPLVTVSSAGVAVELASTGNYLFSSLSIEADENNLGNVYIGDSSVTASNGMTIAPGWHLEIDGDDLGRGQDQFDLRGLYVNSSTMGNKVRLCGLKRL